MNEQEIRRHSLFLYVIDNLDKDGAYNRSPLPDKPLQPYSYGDADAALFRIAETPENQDTLNKIHHLLSRWLANPTPAAKRRLYNAITGIEVITIFFPLVERLKEEHVSREDLVSLAEEWLYTGAHREVLKFVYLLCTVLGPEYIREEYSATMYKDLFTLARCEEFTPCLCLTCTLNKTLPQKELWYLARRTHGWGKAVLLSCLEYDTPQKRSWLVKHGLKLRVFWPPLAPLVVVEGQVTNLVQKKELTLEAYHSVAEILAAYMIYLTPPEPIKQTPWGDMFPVEVPIDLNLLLTHFLRHGEQWATTPKTVLPVLAVKRKLEEIVTLGSWDILPQNATQLLIAKCDKLIYSRDWEPEIRKNVLTSNGRVRQDHVELAANLDIDIWEAIFAFYRKHPENQTALRYLLVKSDKNRDPAVALKRHLDFLLEAQKNLPLYLSDEKALTTLCAYLIHHPGEGEFILASALTSGLEHAMLTATVNLNRWPREAITPALKNAMTECLRATTNPFVSDLLKHLLGINASSKVKSAKIHWKDRKQ